MRKIEYKKIGLGSVFKLFGGMNFVFGFIFGLFGTGLAGMQLRNALGAIPFIGGMLTGVVGALFIGLFSALVGGVYFVLLAVVYNIFAIIMGGIQVEVEDKD